MLGVCIPAIFLNKTRLEDFRIMFIDDSTVGLFEVVNKVLNHPNLHLEPRPFFIPLHHLEERRGNLGNFTLKSLEVGLDACFVRQRFVLVIERGNLWSVCHSQT
jgi:hypothetical protein